MLYQMLFGAWPPDLHVDDAEGLRALADRIAEWQTKSLREAKLRSSWVLPADAYEQACQGFLRAVLDPRRNGRTLLELASFVARAGAAGALNGLAQTLLRMTVPGMPDLYQGTELWDFTLVDPDNRRPVDYALRRAMLEDAAHADPAALVARWRDGGIKQALVRRTLDLRRREPDLFRRGDYLPLTVQGDAAGSVLAFARRYRERLAVVIVPHCAADLVLAAAASPVPHVPAQAWGDTVVSLAGLMSEGILRQVLGGADCRVQSGQLAVGDALARFPVALLYA